MYHIYFLINENYSKTYIGFTNNIERRIKEHIGRKVKSTKNFGKFDKYIIDQAITIKEARKKEAYWKSHSGRKRLKRFLNSL